MSDAAQWDAGVLAQEFVALSDFLYSGGSEADTLQRLVDVAVTSVPGCTSAAVSTWSANKRFLILASTDATSTMVNQIQHELGDGPCLTAASKAEIVRLPDLALDQRWPQFSATVQQTTSVRGILSFHLVAQPVASALSLFSDDRDAFDADAFNVAALFAAHARVLLTHAATAGRAVNLQKALLSSRQIGAAMGILMNAHRITEDEAFELLRDSSRNLNRKLRDIAVNVTQTGALPARP